MNQQVYIKNDIGEFIPYEDAKFTLYDDSFFFISEAWSDRKHYIKVSDVVLFESVGNYSKVLFNNNNACFLASLNHVALRLIRCTYFRANRKQLINIRKIERIEPYYNGGILIYMTNGRCVQVSRRGYVLFKQLIGMK